jgi:hypothetical protein
VEAEKLDVSLMVKAEVHVESLKEEAKKLGVSPALVEYKDAKSNKREKVNVLVEAKRLGERLKASLTQNEGDMASLFDSLARNISYIQLFVTVLKGGTDTKIKEALNLQLNRNRSFRDELARFISGLQQTQTVDADDQDEQDVDDEEEAVTTNTPTAKAFSAFNSAVKAQARATIGKRPLGKNSRSGKIIEWLGDRSLTESNRAEVGISLLIQTAARRFQNPAKELLVNKLYKLSGFRIGLIV